MESVRLDKWLWAARFFKTRSLAKEALISGKVKLSGVSLKASFSVKVDEILSIRRGQDIIEVQVMALSDKRGSAPIAQTLYCETEASIIKRDRVRLAKQAAPQFDQRPDKKQRRQIRAFKTSND